MFIINVFKFLYGFSPLYTKQVLAPDQSFRFYIYIYSDVEIDLPHGLNTAPGVWLNVNARNLRVRFRRYWTRNLDVVVSSSVCEDPLTQPMA